RRQPALGERVARHTGTPVPACANRLEPALQTAVTAREPATNRSCPRQTPPAPPPAHARARHPVGVPGRVCPVPCAAAPTHEPYHDERPTRTPESRTTTVGTCGMLDPRLAGTSHNTAHPRRDTRRTGKGTRDQRPSPWQRAAQAATTDHAERLQSCRTCRQCAPHHRHNACITRDRRAWHPVATVRAAARGRWNH